MGDEAPLTILFTDVEGSTALRTGRGDAVAHEILRAHERVVRECVADAGGREVKALGDGFMIAFGSVRKGLACAVTIQQAMERQRWTSGSGGVRVRIGVNTGEVVAEDDDLYGQAVNAAARIAARAGGGEILVAEVTRQLAGSGPEFTFVDRGRLRLKGFPERWRLYELSWEPDRPADHGAVAARLPYVGRETERSDLRRLLDDAVRGRGALVMVGGEPGVGKTRLAEELMNEATARDVEVFAGHCYEMEGAPPFVAVVEIFEAALARAPNPAAFRALLGDEAAEVARLVPKLRQLCPDIPPGVELSPEQERRQLFNSIRDVVARMARRAPLLVLFDDLHWADDPTLLLVEHLAASLEGLPVLIMSTYRDTEVDVGRPLSKTFEDLRRRGLARWITLGRLPEGEVAQVLRAVSGQEVPPTLLDAIYGETEGNPFFLAEVYRYLAEEGRLFDVDGRLRGDLTIGDLDVPSSVRLVIGRRLQRLDPKTPPVLAAAAVVGRAFSVEVLEAMEDFDPDLLLDAVEDAARAGLISPAPDPSGEDRFIFVHELIRQTLWAGVSLTRRRRLHARVADALERHYAADLDSHAATIAHHLLEASTTGTGPRAFEYLSRAGRFALRSGAYEEALRHFERAVAVDAEGPEVRAAGCDTLPVMLDAGDAAVRAGQRQTARAWYEKVAALAGERQDHRALATAALGVGATVVTAGTVDWALVDLLEQAEEMAGDDAALRSELLSRRAIEMYWDPSLDARSRSAEALELAETSGDDHAIGVALHARQFTLRGPDGLAERIVIGHRLVDLAAARDNLDLAFEGHTWLAADVLRSGDADGFVGQLDALGQVAERSRQPLHHWYATMYAAELAAIRGRADEAQRLTEEAAVLGSRLEVAVSEAYRVAQVAVLARDTGTLADVESDVRRAVEDLPFVTFRAMLSLLLAEAGRHGEACDEIDRMAADRFAAIPADSLWTTTVGLLGEAAAIAGSSHLRELTGMLEPYAGEVLVQGLPACWGAVDRVRGVMAAADGRVRAADQALSAALALHQHLGAPGWAARTRLEQARVAAADGRRSASAAAAGAAAAEAGALGLHGIADAARRLLSDVS